MKIRYELNNALFFYHACILHREIDAEIMAKSGFCYGEHHFQFYLN